MILFPACGLESLDVDASVVDASVVDTSAVDTAAHDPVEFVLPDTGPGTCTWAWSGDRNWEPADAEASWRNDFVACDEPVIVTFSASSVDRHRCEGWLADFPAAVDGGLVFATRSDGLSSHVAVPTDDLLVASDSCSRPFHHEL
ncbi:MAG: hypothetical protein GY884_32480 [Proteobacteria bacterium]|nr:hypothetical protein [Pseudomonadota bacterium]